MRPARCQKWQNFIAQEVAIKAAIFIARIINPVQLFPVRVGDEFITRHTEERSRQPAYGKSSHGLHPSQTSRPAATQEIQQQGFSLVILVMRAEQPVAGSDMRFQRRVTCGACCRLGAITAIRGNANDFADKFELEFLRETLTMPGPGLRIGLQAMIHMDCGQ